MASELESALPPITAVGRQPVNYGHPPSARYSKLSEKIRQSAPGEFQCSMFCGGKKCKYESTQWHKEDMAIHGIYSHWITNDILAMARPNTAVIEKHNVIQQFHEKDYGTVSETMVLDMVKVMSFALSEGKVAVHCHAGLGRTGVLIACYLVYSLRCKPNDAIRYIRIKSIPKSSPLSIHQHISRQKKILHGLEARQLKSIPRVIYIVCERLLNLANCHLQSPVIQNICYDMDSAVSFCNFFLSATSSDDSIWRPSSSLTLMDLDCPSAETTTTSPDGSQDLKSFEACKKPGPPSRGAAYYLGSCDSRCDQSSSDYADSPDFQNRLPPDGRSTGSLSAERQIYDDQDEYLDDYNDYNEDDFETSDESIDSMLMEEPSRMYLANNTCYRELNNQMEISSIAGSSTNGEQLVIDDRITASDIVKALMADHLLEGPEFLGRIKQFQRELNNRTSAWEQLKREKDIMLLTGLLWSFMENLKIPILSKQDLTYIVIRAEKPIDALIRLDKPTRFTTEYFIRFLGRLVPTASNVADDLLRRLVASLTHQSLTIKGELSPVGSNWPKMREGTSRHLMMFVRGLYDIVTGISRPNETPISNNDHPASAGASCSNGKGKTTFRVAGRAYLGLNLMVKAIGKPSSQ